MTRWRLDGQESREEDAILDEMEDVWMNLLEEDRALLSLEGPRCWPADPSTFPPQLTDMLYTAMPTPWTYEGFHSAAEAILSTDAA
jgi:hypothetical protein